MRRIKVIITAIILAIIGSIVPMMAALHFAWVVAFNDESQTLFEYTTRMWARAKLTADQTRKAFDKLNNDNSGAPACSPQHIEWMRTIASSIPEVDTISYYENETEKCTSCGVAYKNTKRSVTEFILPDGLEVINSHLSPDAESSMLILRKGSNYDIYIDPSLLSDVIVPDKTWLAIVLKGKIVSHRNFIDPDLKQTIISQLQQIDMSKYTQKVQGQERLKQALLQLDRVFLLNHNMISISKLGPFYFIAGQPDSVVYELYDKMQRFLLPLGFLTAAFIVGLVIYYSHKRLSMKTELELAIKHKEFVVHYQPVIDANTKTCTGAEALVRWQLSNGEMVRPDLFIPYAEEVGLISAITDQVINIVFAQMGPVLRKNPQLHISINVVAQDIESGRILDVLEAKIANSGINRNQICIELTERTFSKLEKVKEFLQQAKDLGYSIAIDDFGIGYSSLSYLQHLPVDTLKIDKTFIDSIGTNSVTSNVVEHIIDMGKSLKLQLVAEGVSKQQQADYLEQKSVEYIQGNLYSKPLKLEDFLEFLQQS